MASGSIKDPWASGDKIYASANLNGPNPVGTKVCVEIHAMHPYYPDINLGGTCKTINAGTVTTSVHKGACGNYKTYAYATYNGRVFWGPVESPRYQTICS
ncbi:hypothetical protein [Streptomyces sp. NPDC089919]|uniref:hypothetical protein n=1 Tax=Streptomyces sp. NPDC089919 TaxID=3155188 RepID=UPI0034432090